MRVMFLHMDRSVFTGDSATRRRAVRLGEAGIDVDSITFSLRVHRISGTHDLSSVVRAHPTRSLTRLFYGLDALRIAFMLPKPEVISSQDPFETGLIALCIARLRRVPLVVEVHTDFLSPAFATHSLANRFRTMIAGFIIPRADGGYAVTRRLKGAIESRYRVRIPFCVLPIAVDLGRFRSLRRAPERGVLLWVGRFEREKDPKCALRALAVARAAGEEVRLIMLGSGRLYAELCSLASELGIAQHVEFPGWQDVGPYLSRAELGLATSRYEGYGMAIVEALAAGVPVLSTDVGIAREAGAGIAEGSFSETLLAWLRGERAPGALRAADYESKREYAARMAAFYREVASTRLEP